jgi:hypothetical protein
VYGDCFDAMADLQSGHQVVAPGDRVENGHLIKLAAAGVVKTVLDVIE